MRRSTMPYRTTLAAVMLSATLSGAVACRDATEPATDATALPASLAVRSDTPYIAGTIIQHSNTRELRVRFLVAASRASRVDRAWVTVHPDSTLVWRDGRKATPADLTVGRSVVVWVRGPELRSYPVQVTGSAILVENAR